MGIFSNCFFLRTFPFGCSQSFFLKRRAGRYQPLKQHGYFFELLLSQDFSCSALTCFQQQLDCAKMKTYVEEISQYSRTFQRGSDCLEPAVVVDVATVAVAF